MRKSTMYAIGLMSGTSLDGVDLCYVRFSRDNTYGFKILNATTIPYSTLWKEKLQAAFLEDPSNLGHLHQAYGIYLGELLQSFIRENAIEKLDFVASHGHTIFHKPEEQYTLQIGDGAMIAKQIGVKVVADFRSQDVRLGGQGAPLVPVGDRLLFGEYDYCLNLGGFANISFEDGGKRLAFDICPINIVFNHYVQKVGRAFDVGGQFASKGKVDITLEAALNELAYYRKNPPKSLGFEWVKETVIPLIDQFDLSVKDVLATFSQHVALQISKVIQPRRRVLVTGGGVYNTFFMNHLIRMTASEMVIPSKMIIEYKEALIFAFLGYLRLEGETNVLKEVTGAVRDHSSGEIFEV
ncbi:anhydro-N-acetylmuramic acid kinase [Flavobacteriaceae bacterium F08102]|nr:anhydro-N-acetylmuramic acid kinase [Flavobacteriaceae bacterium F08102]